MTLLPGFLILFGATIFGLTEKDKEDARLSKLVCDSREVIACHKVSINGHSYLKVYTDDIITYQKVFK